MKKFLTKKLEFGLYEVLYTGDQRYQVRGDGSRNCKDWSIYKENDYGEYVFVDSGYPHMRLAAEVAQEMSSSDNDGDGVSSDDYASQQLNERGIL